MPTFLIKGAYRLFIYSGDCVEPPHIHVERDNHVAKLWLRDGSVAKTGGFSPAELNDIIRIVKEHTPFLMDRWNGYCNAG